MTTIRQLKNWLAAGILFTTGLSLSVQAQIVRDLHVCNQTPVTNALGQAFSGANGDPDHACKVEIRQVGTGIQPPDPVTGAGHPNNPLLRSSYMGHDITEANLGMFSETFTNRLTNSVAYFTRVFDSPAPADALYYADSVAFTNPLDSDLVDVAFAPFRLVHGEHAGEFDIDTDGDGIPDEMENQVTGTSPSRWDTDGDGFSDYYELTHTDYLRPADADPIDIWLHTPQTAGEPPYISWWTIPGLAYRLEFSSQQPDTADYTNIWNGAATGTEIEIDVEDWVSFPMGFFRVFAEP